MHTFRPKDGGGFQVGHYLIAKEYGDDGLFCGTSEWVPMVTCDDKSEAARIVNYLNGGTSGPLIVPKSKAKRAR